MKKLLILLIAANGALSASAQKPKVYDYKKDADLSRWVLDLNFLGGGYNQNLEMTNTTPNYLNGINVNTGTPGFKNGVGLGGDAQIGFFFGKQRHWGLGTGLLFMRETGDITLNNFHAEYQSVDNNGYTFRQVVTGNNVEEHIKADNFNIPLVLKYKNRFSKHWGFTADAGVLFNLKMKNEYNTHSSFDYEAIYKYQTNGDGSTTPVYEASTVPANGDFLITKAQFVKNNPEGSVQNYFTTKATQGYIVGLGVAPKSQTGDVSYSSGSVGFLVQPSINYFFSDHVALNVGAYYLYQPFTNIAKGDYMLTNKVGDYSSVMQSAKRIETQSYGVNLGLRFFLGNKKTIITIASIDQNAPTICGTCTGSVTLHGLEAGKSAIVSYTMNGAATPTTYTGVVAQDGTIKIPGLCAGTYTGINATIGKNTSKNAITTVGLVDPQLTLTREVSSNITVQGTCDGSITLYGLTAGQHAVVTYSLNGTPQTAYETTVAPDNTILVSGLCEGTYTAIMVTSNKCTATLNVPSTVVLTAPVPAPPPPPVVTPPAVEQTLKLAPVMFDFDKSVIHKSAYPRLDQLAKDLLGNSNSHVNIEGNTDAIGTAEYNQKLSERRAAAVKRYLMDKGVSASQIRTEGDGKRDPVADNKTKEGRRENRNAELQEIKK